MDAASILETRLQGLVHVGDVIDGKYRVESILGHGGMGVVVAARHLQLEERVAIKFVLPEALSNPEVIARFVREARAVARLKSHHVARVIDAGTTEKGLPYLAMEYLEGTDLSAWLKTHGPLSVVGAVDTILQATDAIAEAHAMGIVHRDLKPANLFVTRGADGLSHVKVLDFGISKIPTENPEDFGVTTTRHTLGSPAYMSPEQMQSSGAVDARSDIWSLGVVLFELTTGVLPFVGSSMAEVCVKISTVAPASLAAQRPDAPAGFQAVVERCLEKDRDKRFESVAALARALAPFAGPEGQIAVGRIQRIIDCSGNEGPSPGVVASDYALVSTALSDTPRGRSARGRLAYLSLALALLAITIGLGFFALRSGRTSPSPRAPSAASVSAEPDDAGAPIVTPVDRGLEPARAPEEPRKPARKPRRNEHKPATFDSLIDTRK